MADVDLSKFTGKGEGCEASRPEEMELHCVELQAFQLARTADGAHDIGGIVMAAVRDVMDLARCGPDMAAQTVAIGMAAAEIVRSRR